MLLLAAKLAAMLSTLKTDELLAVHLSGLQGLELAKLHRVQLLPVHLGHHHLVGQLHDLGLVGVVLESTNVGDRLVYRAARTVTRLEAGLVLAGIARLLFLALALVTPVALKVTGAGSVMAAPALKLVVDGEVRGATTASATAIDGHALTAAVATTSTTVRALGDGNIEGGLRSSLVLVVGFFGGGCREGETTGGPLLLGDFGSLLGVGQSQRVTSLVTTTGAATTTATSATCILAAMASGSFKVAEGRSGGTGRGSWGRSHTHVGKCRLITAM